MLDVVTDYDRPYAPGTAYGHYFSQPWSIFPVWNRSDLLRAKDCVYGLRRGGERAAEMTRPSLSIVAGAAAVAVALTLVSVSAQPPQVRRPCAT